MNVGIRRAEPVPPSLLPPPRGTSGGPLATLSMLPASSSLGSLHLDVLIAILGFLRPYDILSLRKTCKDFLALTGNRVVWLHAARRMMEEHDIPPLTFLLSSMDNLMLEHLAVAPARFSRRLLAGEDLEIEPYSITKSTHRYDWDFAVQNRFYSNQRPHSILLAPGGRFLIVLRYGHPYPPSQFKSPSFLILQLWDLGWSGSDTPLVLRATQPILHLRPQYASKPRLAPTLDRSAFYLVFEQSNSAEIHVYRINAFSPTPTIVPVNSLKTGDSLLSLAVSGIQIACYTDKHRIMVWDFESNLVACWMTCVTPELDIYGPLTLHTHGNSILIAYDGKLYQWGIPPLRPLHDFSALEENPPIATYDNLFQYKRKPYFNPGCEPDYQMRDLFAPPQSSWLGKSAGYMLLISYPGAALHCLQRTPASQSTSASDSLVVPTHVDTFHDFEIPDDSIPDELLFCDGNLIYSCHKDNDDEVCIQVITSPVAKEIRCKTTIELLSRNSFHDIVSARLCPATGRLCVLNGSGDIVVADYLKWPTH